MTSPGMYIVLLGAVVWQLERQTIDLEDQGSTTYYSCASLLRAPLLRGFGSVGRGPRISAARGKCQMGLLKPTLNCFENSQETLGEQCQ